MTTTATAPARPTAAPKVRRRKTAEWVTDPAASAERAGLHYTNDQTPGITRQPEGEGFAYFLPGGKRCHEEAALRRIASLVIPPAWTQVWICPSADGHLQATGYDSRNRKQYRYHPDWNAVRNETKFHRMHLFAEHLPAIRQRVNADLASPGITYRKVLALVVRVMERTHIRIGNEEYRKLYGSFGLTTLRDKHVKVTGGQAVFSFKGKKGVEHRISLKSRRLARLVGQCRDIPGQELFQYYDENGQRRPVTSGDVNAYLKEITNDSFTAKDFRTWAGTLHAFQACCKAGEFATAAEAKKNVLSVVDQVAERLGNTRTVCRKYYIHPHILDSYEAGKLCAYFGQEEKEAEDGDLSGTEKAIKELLAERNRRMPS